MLETLLVATLAVPVAIVRLTRPFSASKRVSYDERDGMIVKAATQFQLWAVILSIVGWAIGLTEVYWSRKQIPIGVPVLILYSTLTVNLLGQLAGILLGYRRWGVHG